MCFFDEILSLVIVIFVKKNYNDRYRKGVIGCTVVNVEPN